MTRDIQISFSSNYTYRKWTNLLIKLWKIGFYKTSQSNTLIEGNRNNLWKQNFQFLL